jgi:hypothetical protein
MDVLDNLENQGAGIVRNVTLAEPEIGEPDFEGEANQADPAGDEEDGRGQPQTHNGN